MGVFLFAIVQQSSGLGREMSTVERECCSLGNAGGAAAVGSGLHRLIDRFPLAVDLSFFAVYLCVKSV